MRVLIVDQGRERSSVAASRALASSGWTVGAASPAPNLASRARAVATWHKILHTDDGDEEFVASVDEVVTRHRYDVVFVGWDRAVAAISEHRSRLSVPVGYGPHQGVLLAMDKERLAPVASAAGLSVPRTVAHSRDAIAGLAGVVVKPASPIECSLSARVFVDPDAALERAGEIAARGARAVIQERLSGTLMALSLVAGPEGIASIAQQIAEQTWPRGVGITARGLSVAVDPTLRAAVERLLHELGWLGLAHLQFLVPADGQPRLIDFNARLYGSLSLAIAAGANHPDAWARVASGRPTRTSIARAGARYQWFSRDLRASWSAPHRVRETLRCAYVALTGVHNLWSWQQPLLAPRFLAEQAARGVSRRLGEARVKPSARSSAALHGAPPTPEVLKALRQRRIPPYPGRAAQRLRMKAGRLTFEEDWLVPLQAARREALGAAAEGPPRLLVRVDEFPDSSGYDNPKLGRLASERFHDVMAEEGVHHLMSIVPQWTHEPKRPGGSGGRAFDDADRALLERLRADGVTFAQHGATHRTRHPRPSRQSELCGLDNARLGELLDGGRRSLAGVGVHPRVFVAPFNRFDAGQWPALAARYDVVTGGPESVMLMGFHGGPQWRDGAIYLPCYAPLYDSAAAVIPAVDWLIAEAIGTWIPIVLHMGWEVEDDFATLRRLARRIAPYTVSWEDFLSAAERSRGR
jgi:predicted ATP-grasp superfamily ATP-dependent carboligase